MEKEPKEYCGKCGTERSITDSTSQCPECKTLMPAQDFPPFPLKPKGVKTINPFIKKHKTK